MNFESIETTTATSVIQLSRISQNNSATAGCECLIPQVCIASFLRITMDLRAAVVHVRTADLAARLREAIEEQAHKLPLEMCLWDVGGYPERDTLEVGEVEIWAGAEEVLVSIPVCFDVSSAEGKAGTGVERISSRVSMCINRTTGQITYPPEPPLALIESRRTTHCAVSACEHVACVASAPADTPSM
jgi:hypothetical protein